MSTMPAYRERNIQIYSDIHFSHHQRFFLAPVILLTAQYTDNEYEGYGVFIIFQTEANEINSIPQILAMLM